MCCNLKTGVIKHPKHGDVILNPAYQEMGETEAAKVSLDYYAKFIQRTYLETKGFVERLDMIDPSPENYWTQKLPEIENRILALPSDSPTLRLEEQKDEPETL